MKAENYEVIENEDQKESTELEVTVIEKDSFGTKLKKGVKKHGKKIGGAIVLCVAGIAAYALGKKSGSKQVESDDYDDIEIIDLDAEDYDAPTEE